MSTISNYNMYHLYFNNFDMKRVLQFDCNVFENPRNMNMNMNMIIIDMDK